MDEGGIRVPFVASWPARWPQGVTFDAMVSRLDIVATSVAMAGTSVGDAPPLHGVNLDPFVRGEATAPPHEALFWRQSSGGGRYAVRSGAMKLISKGDGARLHDVVNDPGETTDLLADNVAEANRLGALFNAWNEANPTGNIMAWDVPMERAPIAAGTRKAGAGQRFEIAAFRDPTSSDASLLSLALSGIDIGRFEADVTDYSAEVAHAVSSTTVTAVPRDGRASVTIGDATGVTLGLSHEASLAEGSNVVTAKVTAQDAGERTDTVTVTQAQAPLAAEFARLPERHGGEPFTFQVRFSEAIGTGASSL